jgi:hypothetical protein
VDAALDAAAVADVRGGLPRKAKVAKTLSMRFFSTAGMLWLYSGVTNRQASSSAILEFQCFTTGAQKARGLGPPTAANVPLNSGSGKSRRSGTSMSNLPCSGDIALIRGIIWSAARPGRVLPKMISRFRMLVPRFEVTGWGPVGSVAAGSWRHR